MLCFNRKFIRAAYVHDSCLGKFVESKTHKVANRLRKIKWNKRPMKRKSTTYITSWVLPGDTTDVHLLFTIWHCKIFWVVLTGRLLSSNKAGESACLWRVVCFQEWLMSSLCCSSSFSSNHSICSLKKTSVQVEDILWLAIDKKEKWLGDIKDLSEPSQNIGLSFDSFFCNCLKRMKWERLMLITLNQNTKEIAPYFTFSIKTKIHYLAPNENIKKMQIQNVNACITIGHKNLPFF